MKCCENCKYCKYEPWYDDYECTNEKVYKWGRSMSLEDCCDGWEEKDDGRVLQ